MEIKTVLEEDLPKVVCLHKDSFRGFFLTELGDHFLRVYYDCVRKDKKGVLIGLYQESNLYGFFAATTLSQGFNKQLVKSNLVRFSGIGLRLLFTRIPSLVRLIRNLTKTSKEVEDKGEYAELLSIGVAVNQQGKGIGKKLLIQLEKEMRLKGCTSLSLTTDYYDNEKALQFYKSLGYSVYYDFITYPHRKMYRLIKKLDQQL